MVCYTKACQVGDEGRRIVFGCLWIDCGGGDFDLERAPPLNVQRAVQQCQGILPAAEPDLGIIAMSEFLLPDTENPLPC